jgi:uncharacterized C2H2 Zn-finger protein
MLRAAFSITKIDRHAHEVWIVDECAAEPRAPSITNDAEAVCAHLEARFAGYRIFYRDTMGEWDELVHEAGAFKRFAPARAYARAQGMAVVRCDRCGTVAELTATSDEAPPGWAHAALHGRAWLVCPKCVAALRTMRADLESVEQSP